MRNLILVSIITWIAFQGLNSQPVDIMVKNTLKHEIKEDGTLSGNYFTCDQKTYVNNNQLTLERYYNDKIRMQDGYTWYFYDGTGRLKSVESYDIDGKPRILKQIQYKETADTLKITEYTGSSDTVKKSSEKVYYYNAAGQLTLIKTFSPESELIESTKNSYKSGIQQPVKTIIINKSANPWKAIIKTAFNDTTGQPLRTVKQVNQYGIKKRFTVMIAYNIKGKPVEEKYMTEGKVLTCRKSEYAADIELVRFYDEDGSGKMTGLYTVETYWHKANLNARSYFE